MSERVIEFSGHYFLRARLSKQPVVVDLGLCKGDFAIPFLQQHGGVVYGVEPCKYSLRRAERRWRAVGSPGSLTIEQAVVWPIRQRIKFHMYPDRLASNSVFERPGRGKVDIERLPTITLSSILRRRKRVDILKMDIEGSEYEVLLNTPRRLLKKVNQFSIELHCEYSGGKTVSDLAEYMEGAGFAVLCRDPKKNRPELWGHPSRSAKMSEVRYRCNRWLRSLLRERCFGVVLNLGSKEDRDKNGVHYADYFSCDKMIKMDIRKFKGVDVVASAEDIPLPDNSVDFVFMNQALDVVNRPEKALKEIQRVTVPGGYALFSYGNISPARVRWLSRAVRTVVNVDVSEEFVYQMSGQPACFEAVFGKVKK